MSTIESAPALTLAQVTRALRAFVAGPMSTLAHDTILNRFPEGLVEPQTDRGVLIHEQRCYVRRMAITIANTLTLCQYGHAVHYTDAAVVQVFEALANPEARLPDHITAMIVALQASSLEKFAADMPVCAAVAVARKIALVVRQQILAAIRAQAPEAVTA